MLNVMLIGLACVVSIMLIVMLAFLLSDIVTDTALWQWLVKHYKDSKDEDDQL